jgi:maltose O-acetyltransferase
MPGVTVGAHAIVAAGSVVTKSVEAGTVVGGNPAQFIMKTEDLMDKHRSIMKTAKIYDSNWLIQNGITNAMKKQMSDALVKQTGYVE